MCARVSHIQPPCARSDHVGLGVGAATLEVLYLVKNPVDVRSLLGIGHHYGAKQHLEALGVTRHKTGDSKL